MDNELQIDEHAFKHGIGADDIAYAWEHYLAMQFRGAPHEGEVVVIGCDAKGRLVQMVAVTKARGLLVIHAMRPPTDTVMKELGLARRGR